MGRLVPSAPFSLGVYMSKTYWEIGYQYARWDGSFPTDIIRYDNESDFNRALELFRDDTQVTWLQWRKVEYSIEYRK